MEQCHVHFLHFHAFELQNMTPTLCNAWGRGKNPHCCCRKGQGPEEKHCKPKGIFSRDGIISNFGPHPHS